MLPEKRQTRFRGTGKGALADNIPAAIGPVEAGEHERPGGGVGHVLMRTRGRVDSVFPLSALAPLKRPELLQQARMIE